MVWFLRCFTTLTRFLNTASFIIFKVLALVNIGPKNESERTEFQHFVNRSMWLVGTFRNSIVIIVTTYVGFVYTTATGHDTTSDKMPPIPFKVVGMLVTM